MASIATRTCLRQLARPSTAARALSTSSARAADSTASSYSSPFKGTQKGDQIPDFKDYVSKNSKATNQFFGYFMVGTMGAITAAGAKSTVQGRSRPGNDARGIGWTQLAALGCRKEIGIDGRGLRARGD
jgi:hypothetical protein